MKHTIKPPLFNLPAKQEKAMSPSDLLGYLQDRIAEIEPYYEERKMSGLRIYTGGLNATQLKILRSDLRALGFVAITTPYVTVAYFNERFNKITRGYLKALNISWQFT